MTHTRISRIISIATCLTMVASAQQEPIEILLDDTTLGEEVAEGKFVEAGGVIMAVTQVVATDGGDVAAVDDFGILFGTDTEYNDVVSLTISFNMDVRVVDYEIGSREDVPGGMHFTISGPEGASGQNPIPPFEGFIAQEVKLPYVRGGLSVLKAGQNYTITHNLLDATNHDPIFNLESLIVSPLDLSIATMEDTLKIDYVGILQQWDSETGWQDMNPQPPNVWEFTPEALSMLFRSKRSDVMFDANSGNFEAFHSGTFGAFVNDVEESSLTIHEVQDMDLVWYGMTVKTSRMEARRDDVLLEYVWKARAADGSIYMLQREAFEPGAAPFEGLQIYLAPVLWYPGAPFLGQRWTDIENGARALHLCCLTRSSKREG